MNRRPLSRPRARRPAALVVMSLGLALTVPALSLWPAQVRGAGLFSHGPSRPEADNPKAAAVAAQVRQALDEERNVDAATLLDQANIMGIKSPALIALKGELLLARGEFADALAIFQTVPKAAGQASAVVLQGEGIALSKLGKSDEALADLKQATDLDKSLWRAWNALGCEYDMRRDWANAQAAYEAALVAPGVKVAIVLNNRGYSWLLQHRAKAAAESFLAALQKDPGLAAARTNLRIALAWQGAYDRATTVGAGDDRATVLNNVGVAAAVHGDYAEAEKYLGQAMAARGQFYGRASENLQMTRGLAAQGDGTAPVASDAPH